MIYLLMTLCALMCVITIGNYLSYQLDSTKTNPWIKNTVEFVLLNIPTRLLVLVGFAFSIYVIIKSITELI